MHIIEEKEKERGEVLSLSLPLLFKEMRKGRTGILASRLEV